MNLDAIRAAELQAAKNSLLYIRTIDSQFWDVCLAAEGSVGRAIDHILLGPAAQTEDEQNAQRMVDDWFHCVCEHCDRFNAAAVNSRQLDQLQNDIGALVAAARAPATRLYHAINALMAELGAVGEIDTRNPLVDVVMDALHDIDGGVAKEAA